MLRVADFAAGSDVGRVRRANEDAYYLKSPLFVVADGMGGAQAGEVASELAVESFRRPLDESAAPEPRLAAAVQNANRAIHEQSRSNEQLQGMGTTVTALLLDDDSLTVAHVGDSRAYRMRGGELTRLTDDHSLVGEMVRRGAITEAEAEVHPQRSILTRALGPEAEVEIDTLTHGVRPGDVYLICSDGLTGMVADQVIAEQLGSGAKMQTVVDELIRLANEAGGMDNITALAFTVEDGAGAGTSAPQADEVAADSTGVGPAVETEAHSATLATPAAVPQTAAANGALDAAERDSRSTAAYERRRASTGRSRRRVGTVIACGVVVIALAGAVVASLNVFFIGGNDQGLVTVYRGLPYDLPGVSLYTRDYVTGTPVSDLPPALSARILDHRLRSRADALDLAQQIDAGRIDLQGTGGEPTGSTGGN